MLPRIPPASTSRPFTEATYCICWPGGAGSAPIVPAGATTFCSLMMSLTSSVVTPRRAIFFRVEPDAHAVVARAEYHDLADSAHARERVVHMQRGEVGQEQIVVARIVGADRDDQQDLRLPLGDRDALLQHLRGQLALRDGDLVLHVDGGDVLRRCRRRRSR